MIAILMAVYNPRMDWLTDQLHSLNMQTYKDVKLYIRDDCSSDVSFERIRCCVQECITSFPFVLRRNDNNIGSNGTFEKLTEEAEGDYFAYCDQDDIWLPDKLNILVNTIVESNVSLVCSDMYIIDGYDNHVENSITKVRRHHRFLNGSGLASKMFVSNFVTGCTMIIRSNIAKEAMPFCPYMVHDHYLGLYAATKGNIISLPDPLIYYRIHDRNQTPVMAGVTDKKSYYEKRILLLRKRIDWLSQKEWNDPKLSSSLTDAKIWVKAREEFFLGKRNRMVTIIRFMRFGPAVSLFEIFVGNMPNRIFMFFINLTRRNII